MPNALAYAALLIWPVAAAALATATPRRTGLIWALLGGYLLLPQATAVNLPGVPAYDRDAAISFGLLLAVAVAGSRREGAVGKRWLPRSPLARALLLLYFIAPVGTTLTNSEPYFPGGGVRLPPMSLYDLGSILARQAITIAPLLVARRYLRDGPAVEALLSALALAAAAYALLMLVEMRISPQLHRLVYGFHQHVFIQTMRDGGYRPMVFFQNGLHLAIFMAMAAVAAAGLARAAAPPRRRLFGAAAAWIALVLALARSLGAQALCAVVLPLALVRADRLKALFVLVVAATAVAYPLMRSAGLVPTAAIVEIATDFHEERGRSLGGRFEQETILLARLAEKPVFGWGAWGRNRVYDPETGADVTFIDSEWIQILSVYGWAGFLASFGLLAAPLMRLARPSVYAAAPAVAALSLALSVGMLDMLVNATLSPVTFFLAGSLLGVAEERGRVFSAAAPPTPAAPASAWPRSRVAIGALRDDRA